MSVDSKAVSTLAGAVTALALLLTPSAHAGDAPAVREATLQDVRSFARAKGMKILTFAGYSGAGYEDPAAMLGAADRVLEGYDPARTLVNIGATAEGIGAVYEVARRRGFVTIGIVSTLARDEQVPLSPSVDYVFYVRDATWGGRVPGSTRLAPTSAAIVGSSSAIVGIGGGEIARDEMLAARRAGKAVTFIPADMNHQLARDKAARKDAPEPTDFRGAAHAAFAPRQD